MNSTGKYYIIKIYLGEFLRKYTRFLYETRDSKGFDRGLKAGEASRRRCVNSQN